jgi:RND family efflux transporter MFP subunit
VKRAAPFALLLLLLPLGCGRNPRAGNRPAKTLGLPVKVAPVSRGLITRTLLVTGSLRSDQEVQLSSKVLGRVEGVFVKEGDRVRKGQLLVSLEQADFQAQLAQARAALESARIRRSQTQATEQLRYTQTDSAIAQARQAVAAAQARLLQAQAAQREASANLARAENLHREGAISAQQRDSMRTADETARAGVTVAEEMLAQAKQSLEVARANRVQYQLTREDIRAAEQAVKQAQAQVALASDQLRNTRLLSPISGLVSLKLVSLGETVSPGLPLLTLVGLDSIYFEAEVPETEVANLALGQSVEVTVDAAPGRTLTGTLRRIVRAITSSSRTFRLRIALPPPPDLLLSPGSFARGRILIGRRTNALLIPKDALQTTLGESFIFLAENNRARRSSVKLGWSDPDHVEILHGAAAGDRVIVVGASTLRDGDPIRLLP